MGASSIVAVHGIRALQEHEDLHTAPWRSSLFCFLFDLALQFISDRAGLQFVVHRSEVSSESFWLFTFRSVKCQRDNLWRYNKFLPKWQEWMASLEMENAPRPWGASSNAVLIGKADVPDASLEQEYWVSTLWLVWLLVKLHDHKRSLADKRRLEEAAVLFLSRTCEVQHLPFVVLAVISGLAMATSIISGYCHSSRY